MPIDDMTLGDLENIRDAIEIQGKEMFLSKNGIRVCAWCKQVIGELPMPAPALSHGICWKCAADLVQN